MKAIDQIVSETIQHHDGRVIIEDGKYKGQPGNGQFLKRGTCVAM